MSFLTQKIKNERTKLVIILVISFLFIPSSTHANIVLEETFDTELSSDWWISNGTTEIQDGELVATECAISGIIGKSEFCGTSIWRTSTEYTGTWSVDYYMADPASSAFLFYFIGEGVSSSSGAWPNSDYMVFLFGTNYMNGNIRFGYHHNDGDGLANNVVLPLVTGWMHFDVTRDVSGNMTLYLDREEISNFNEISPVNDHSEHMNFQLAVGDKIDNLVYYDTVGLPPVYTPPTSEDPPISSDTNQTSVPVNISSPPSDESNVYYLGAGIIGTSGISALLLVRKKRALAKAVQHVLTSDAIAKTSQEFHLTEYSVMALVTKPSKNNLIGGKVMDSLPTELLDHRYLMHPIRITIMKLLEANEFLPSAEVKHILGVSWGEYNAHMKSLEEKGHIAVENTFNANAQLILTIRITDQGRSEYLTLHELLKQFTGKQAPIRRLVGNDAYPIYDSNLYPVQEDS